MKKLLFFITTLCIINSIITAQITAPAPSTTICACNPNGWQPGTAVINTQLRPITCGYQFSLKCTDKITIKQEYKCLGNCTAKYSAVLKNAVTGAVIMNYPSFTFPWNYQFTVAGNYSLEITPQCGNTRCAPCRYYFTVTCAPVCDCSVAGWQPFTATISNNPPQTVNCGFQFGVPKGKPFKLVGKYVCKGTCIAKYTAVLKNNVTGAIVQNYASFTFPWVYTFGVAGNYKLEIIPVCGDKRCTPCVFYFTVN
jgi:hypothetical protein